MIMEGYSLIKNSQNAQNTQKEDPLDLNLKLKLLSQSYRSYEEVVSLEEISSYFKNKMDKESAEVLIDQLLFTSLKDFGKE